ncbi:MAG: ketoacyl-ACP synthase III [Candidatus Cloacimonetes bacterium]|nr:ketoacyl-ACP synthase III [Candidatus Cloacimonadota bacterium]
MGIHSFENVGIKALSAAVPRRIIDNLKYTDFFSEAEAIAIVEKTGVYQRRFVDDDTCSSDLCFAATEKLIEDNNLERDEIDLMVFISQTPDYRMPATSFLLQSRLKLSTDTIVFDVNMGCSGFIHGLFIVYSMMHNLKLRKALLLNGETRSKVYSPKDRPVAYLFGDAGSAALIERDAKFGKSIFSINSNGENAKMIMIPAGGYRNPSSSETTKEKVVDEKGNIRSDEHGFMQGEDVFQWLLKNVPKDINNIMQFSQNSLDNIDYFVFHQANRFMNSYIAKKLKLVDSKIPSTMAKYGNTSSVSIPLTIISELQNSLLERKKLLLSGFGVGMTWASAIIETENCRISDIVEV